MSPNANAMRSRIHRVPVSNGSLQKSSALIRVKFCQQVRPYTSCNVARQPQALLAKGHSHSRSQTTPQKFCSSLTPTMRSISSTVPSTNPPVALINDLPKGFQEVVVDFNDGSEAIRFPSFWLRDHCRCHECCHPQTKQRQLDTFALNPNIKALETDVVSTPSNSFASTSTSTNPTTETGLKITWSGSPSHTSTYPISWLKRQLPFSSLPPSTTQNPRGKWQHVSPTSTSYPSTDYPHAMTSDSGLSQLLSQIRTYGFAFIPNTPFDSPEHTKQLAERIGTTIRHTHYGGFWEVVSEANPIDTAYTNLFLPNHTDNTYFTDPCGLQMFHSLSHTPSASSSSSESQLGGASTLVDGFAAAAHLHRHFPQHYRLLSTVPIVSHASGDPRAGPFFNNALHTAGHPVFTHAGSAASGQAYHHPQNLSQIRWNNCDRHEATIFPSHSTMIEWYEAARVWESLVNPKGSKSSSGATMDGAGGGVEKGEGGAGFEIVVKLQPGTPVVFDNWRVLHGRKSFEGVRRLCGAYIGMDDFLAKGRVVDERVGEKMDQEGGEQ